MQPWVYFLIMGVFFFLMMRGGCGSHVMGHGRHRDHNVDSQLGTAGSVPTAGPAMVTDPVCGMTIGRLTAKTSVHRGTIYYFCSDQCRSKFEAAPETFAASAA